MEIAIIVNVTYGRNKCDDNYDYGDTNPKNIWNQERVNTISQLLDIDVYTECAALEKEISSHEEIEWYACVCESSLNNAPCIIDHTKSIKMLPTRFNI